MSISTQQAQIESLYIGYFNRSSEPAGLAYWTARLEAGLSLAQIAQSFSVQPEATALYPFLVNPTQGSEAAFLGSVYANIFNRPIDAEGLAYWAGQLDGGKPVGRIILDMISGAQGADRVALDNKTTIGVEYAQAFEGAHRTWTSADLASAHSVPMGVTSDPATVTAAEAKIADLFASAPTPAPTPTPTPTITPTPTPTPDPTPASAPTTMNLVAAGDSVALNGTTGTITLTGADLVTFPAAKYGTVALALASGALFVGSTAGGTLDATGNSAATTYNFGTGVVGGTDTVNSKMTYQGFTSYVASSHGDTVTLTGTGQNVTGGAGADTINGGPGTHTVSGGGGADTFNVTAGTVTITDFQSGGADVLAVSSGAAANATLAAAWTATGASSNAGTASVNAAGFTLNVAPVGGTSGWALSNSGGAAALTGSGNNDTITGGGGNDTLTGKGGDDAMTGGGGVDTFNVDTGTDIITDLALGSGQEMLVVSSGATANATATAAWSPTAQTSNDGTASVTVSGFSLNLSLVTGTKGWTLTNTGAGGGITGSANDDIITGGSAGTSLDGGGGDDILTGGEGDDTFIASAGTDTITDLGAGGEDVLTVLSSATGVHATLAADWAPHGANNSSIDATGVTIDVAGFNIDCSGIFTGVGLTLTNSGGGASMRGSDHNDTITGGSGADTLTGFFGNDSFVFASQADTRSASFAGSDTTANNVDRIADFTGNGAANGDVIRFGTDLGAFGGGIQFTGASTAVVSAVSSATAADFSALAAIVQTDSGGGVASTSATARVYDVTVAAGNLAGNWLILNDENMAITTNDTFIYITGINGALNAADFQFA